MLRSIIARATKNIQLGRSPRMSIESTTPINGASIVGERCVSNSFEKGFFWLLDGNYLFDLISTAKITALGGYILKFFVSSNLFQDGSGRLFCSIL